MVEFGQFIINHWQLWVAFLIILLLILINELMAQKKRTKELSPAAAIQLINDEDAVVVDLRDAEAFRSGHIIHAMRASLDDFSTPRMEKYKTRPILLVCVRGVQSQSAATRLRTLGYTQLMVLAGGITAWNAASLPVVKGNK